MCQDLKKPKKWKKNYDGNNHVIKYINKKRRIKDSPFIYFFRTTTYILNLITEDYQ